MENRIGFHSSSLDELSSYQNNINSEKKEIELLERICNEYDVDIKTIKHLIQLEKSMVGKIRRRGLQSQIDTIIQSALISKEGGNEEYVIEESDI